MSTNHGGMPLKYPSPEGLRTKVEEYFKWVDEENVKRRQQRFTEEKFKPYTITGICVFCGLSRENWREYGAREGYEEIIRDAKIKVENYVEEGVLNGKINTIGGIFNLKNNFGWVDKTEVSVNANNDRLSDDDIERAIKDRKKLEAIDVKRLGDGEG